MTPTPIEFTRTSCACETCVACCTRQPGPLAPGDFERIAGFLALDPFLARAFFWASPGAVLGDRQTGRTFRVETITPRYEQGRCVFLTPDDRCAIHPVAPFGCAFVDPHMPEREFGPRLVWLYRTIASSGDYRALRASLVPATHHDPVVG